MIRGQCHCGAVRFEFDDVPEKLTDCNCTACRRFAALWAYADIDKIRILAESGATLTYVWGDKSLAFHTCRTCGCTTHWENLASDGEHMAVNCRMSEPQDIEGIRIRHFDGAHSWQYLD